MNSMKKMSAALLAALMLTGACAQAETVTGTATGMGAVSVELTVEDGKITAAAVDTSHETVGIGQELGEQFAAQIVEKQGEFDAVSGATITSTAVKTALSSAMQQAGLAEAASVSMTPGVYVGTARSSRSDIKMAVEVDETTIKNIWNVENGDSPVFSQMAIDAMADEIVDAQSLAVDTYTGATISSRGAIMAVENALRQAGVDTTAFYANGVEHALTPGEDIDVDVLVVGGGTSGLVAALAADTDSRLSTEKSGLKVLVVERNSFAGGDLNFTGGFIASPSGTIINDATGASVDPVTFGRAMIAGHPELMDKVNTNALDAMMENSVGAQNGLIARGFYMNVEDGAVAEMDDFQYSYALTSEYKTGVRTILTDGQIYYNASPYEAESLRHLVADAGIEVRTNTEATGLIVNDNVCTGVTVQDRDHTYTINAKKVILATGYGGFDAESIEEFYPQYSKVVPAQNVSNTSDAQKWIKAMGGDVLAYAPGDYIPVGINAIYGESTTYSTFYREPGTMWVNASGNRFFDESLIGTEGSLVTSARLWGEDGDGFAYLIFDSTLEKGVEVADWFIDQKVGFKADSIEELAAQIGVPAENLKSTVEAYNASVAAGKDDAFGTPAEWMNAIAEGPFYAVKASPVSTASLALSVWVDDDMTITLTQNGQRVENLLAAGGVCGYTVCPVIGYGTHVYEALVSGAYTGNCARQALIGK